MAAPSGTRKIIYFASGEPGPDFRIEVVSLGEGQSDWDFVDGAAEVGANAIKSYLDSHPTWGDFGGGMKRGYEVVEEDTSWPS